MTKIRVVLVGAGAMGSVWASVISSDNRFDLVGISDVSKSALDDLSNLIDFSGETDVDLSVLLQKLRPDLVVDVTPPFARESVVKKAILSGSNVLCEKPFGDSFVVAKRLSDLADTNNKFLMISQNYRWHPAVETIVKVLHGSDVGKLLKVSVSFGVKVDFDGFRQAMKHPLLLDMAVHHFDLARKFIGTDAKSVYCMEYQLGEGRFLHPASATAIFEMKNGVLFRYDGSLTVDSYIGIWNGRWDFVCENGSVIWDGLDGLEIIKSGTLNKISVPSLKKDKLGVSLDRIYDALINGIEPETGYKDNLKTSEMVFGAIKSSEQARKVSFDEL